MTIRFSSKSLSSISVLRGLAWVLAFNTGIAVLTSALQHGSWADSMLVSQSFGLPIYACFVVFDRFAEIRLGTFWLPLLIGTATGLALLVLIWALRHGAGAAEVWAAIATYRDGIAQSTLIALLFSLVIIYFLVTRSRVAHVSSALQEARLKNLAHEKRMVEAQLRLLQAQIEPHFLFNTLSNVLSLVDIDPARGKNMLASLTRYLRSTLTRSREHDATLRQEIDLIRDYLDIFTVRMGKRLRYTVDIPEDCLEQRFLPMLLQPLVENAIRHGLEPAAGGGEIRIVGERDGAVMRLQVSDNGLGLRHDTESGFGLANVRERLRSLYGEKAGLSIEALAPGGVKAVIEVPYVTG